MRHSAIEHVAPGAWAWTGVVAMNIAKETAIAPGIPALKSDCGDRSDKDNGKAKNHCRIIDKTLRKLKAPGLRNKLNKACFRILFMNERLKKLMIIKMQN